MQVSGKERAWDFAGLFFARCVGGQRRRCASSSDARPAAAAASARLPPPPARRSERWRALRVAWQPTFTGGSLHGYMPVMAECTGLLVERLEVRPDWLSSRRQRLACLPLPPTAAACSPPHPRRRPWPARTRAARLTSGARWAT
jgi:hypothetical protein